MNVVVFQLANYTLSFLMWLIVGRGVLRLITGGRSTIVALAFAKVTDPVYALTQRALPFVGEPWLPAVSFFLIAALRVAMILAFHPAAGS